MQRIFRVGAPVAALFALLLAFSLPACDAYDEGLLQWDVSGSGGSGGTGGQSGNGGGGGAGQTGGEGGGGDSGSGGYPDGGVSDAEPADGAGPPEPGCVPGMNDDCPWSCPERCDGADNDCDGDTDEGTGEELCDLDNATAQCIKGSCVIDECIGLFDDCDSEDETGCETALDTLTDCGQCETPCPGSSCEGGVCGATEGCDPGWANCNEADSDGCEIELGTDSDCSACGDDCSALDHVQSASCVSDQCVINACASGWDDCDGDPDNGCERDLGLGGCDPDIDIFVDATASGADDGTSWEDAYTDLTAAIAAAGPGAKVGAKEGTYTGVPYALKSGVQIYGGFSSALTGTYGYIAGRDLANDVTAIDGGDSSRCLSPADYGHLNGFTLQNCRAGGEGGVIYINAADMTFEKCVFKNGRATGAGGAMRVLTGGSGLQVIDSLFEGNQGTSGGAIYSSTSISFTNCSFRNNSSTASHAGALRLTVGGSTCSRCVFADNTGTFEGGAVYVTGAMTFTDSVFTDNDSGAAYVGGALRVVGTGLSCANCLFANNTGSGGGGVFADSGGDTYTNCTFAGNRATSTYGGGVWGAATTSVVNSIFWDNTATAGDPQVYPATAGVNSTDIQAGWGSGSGNLDADPLFATGPDGDYYLSEDAAGQPGDSPCIDAGNDTAANLGLENRTTRTDSINDSGTVDLGYHY